MKYIGLETQIRRNNTLSALLLFAFPLLILFLVYLFFFFTRNMDADINEVNTRFLYTSPIVIAVVGVWFMIAFFSHTSIINASTGAQTLIRKENMRVYNLVENLCISQGMTMPKVNIIRDQGLNAFASGINQKSYAITLTEGLIDTLNDDELEAVIAHELAHIKNKDVRLLIISIVFVGILAFASEILLRMLVFSRPSKSKEDGKNNQVVILIALGLALLGYLLSVLFRFSLSRKREFLADAGAVDMTKKPLALASALKKVSGNYKVSTVKSDEVADLFFENRKEVNKSNGFDLKSFFHNLFTTHPPIKKRIEFLEQM